MCPRRVLLNLLPKHVILLEFFKPRMVLLQYKRIISELLLWQEHLDEPFVGLGLFFDELFPQILFWR
jgi:hypothetical protein